MTMTTGIQSERCTHLTSATSGGLSASLLWEHLTPAQQMDVFQLLANLCWQVVQSAAALPLAAPAAPAAHAASASEVCDECA